MVEKFITQDFTEKAKTILDKVLQSTETTNFEFLLITKDDMRFAVLLNAMTRWYLTEKVLVGTSE